MNKEYIWPVPRLKRLSYQRYLIADGPAEGSIIEAGAPGCLAVYRWTCRTKTDVFWYCTGFTLRGMAKQLQAGAAAIAAGHSKETAHEWIDAARSRRAVEEKHPSPKYREGEYDQSVVFVVLS